MIKIGWELEWFKIDAVDGNGVWSLFLQGAENVIGGREGSHCLNIFVVASTISLVV